MPASGTSPAVGTTGSAVAVDGAERVGVWSLGLYFLRLGSTGFGGPIALAGAMQRTLVDERRWVSRDEYLEALALAQLAPGPLAAQLAIYLGYLKGGVWGATVVGVAFVLPSFLIVWAVAALYVRFGGLWWMGALFYGIGAAVIVIVARSVVKLARLALGRDVLLIAIAAGLAIATAASGRENVWLVLTSGVIVVVTRRSAAATSPALWLAWPVMASSVSPDRSLSTLAWFFARAGAFVFGSGLAIVPFLYGGVVQDRHWLTEQQFIDAVAVAMITPGPVVITVAFIGYLVRGAAGMTIAAVAVFAPVYLVVIAVAPWFHRVRSHAAVKDFVAGVTAAAVGAIVGAAVLLARRMVMDLPTASIATATLLVSWRWRISDVWLIAAAGGLGLWLH